MDSLQKIKDGDQQALKELYKELSVKVFNTAISYVQNESDAEEITQDVFIEVFNSAKNFRGQSSVSTWVYQITVRKSLDAIKHKTRAKRFGNVLSIFGFDKDEIDLPDFEHPGIILEKKEDATYLFKAIYDLSENQKTAFILCYVEDLPQKEIAEIMNLKLKAVESLLQRAKANLRKKLK